MPKFLSLSTYRISRMLGVSMSFLLLAHNASGSQTAGSVSSLVACMRQLGLAREWCCRNHACSYTRVSDCASCKCRHFKPYSHKYGRACRLFKPYFHKYEHACRPFKPYSDKYEHACRIFKPYSHKYQHARRPFKPYSHTYEHACRPFKPYPYKCEQTCRSYHCKLFVDVQAFHALYHTDENVLLGAPTGSGKTISAELAMLRIFNHYPGQKIIYIAPLKVPC